MYRAEATQCTTSFADTLRVMKSVSTAGQNLSLFYEEHSVESTRIVSRLAFLKATEAAIYLHLRIKNTVKCPQIRSGWSSELKFLMKMSMIHVSAMTSRKLIIRFPRLPNVFKADPHQQLVLWILVATGGLAQIWHSRRISY